MGLNFKICSTAGKMVLLFKERDELKKIGTYFLEC